MARVIDAAIGQGAGQRRRSSAIHGRHERDHRLEAVHDIISYYETM